MTMMIKCLAVVILLSVIAKADEAGWRYDTPHGPMPQATWLEKAVMVCMPYQTPYEKTDSGYVAKPWAKCLQDAGFVIVGMYPDSFLPLYDASDGDPNWKQKCRSEVQIMHGLGMKVLAGVYPSSKLHGPKDLLAGHPEWWMQQGNRTPEGDVYAEMIEPNFSKALRELLVSREKEFNIDGYQFDGWYQFGHSQNPATAALYRQETGRDVPPKMNMTDPSYIPYLVWRDRKLLDTFIALREAVKEVNPDFVLVQWNNNDLAGSLPSNMPEAITCVADWTNKEWWSAFDVSGVWLNKRLRGASGDERVPAMQPYMFMRWIKDVRAGVYHGSSTPQAELMYRLHEIMAMGAIPIAWSGARAGWKDRDWNEVVQAYLDFLPYVHQTRSLKYAVCIDSYTTLQNGRLAASRHEGEAHGLDGEVGNYRAGITRALVEERIPFDVISEHNVTLESLSDYAVVILPNNFCMSHRIAGVLRDYVARGGGLVATFESSLYDENGIRRDDYALADLFGAHYVSSSGDGLSRIGFAAAKHPVADGDDLVDLMGTGGMTTYFGRFDRVHIDANAVAPLAGIDVRNASDPKLKTWTPLVLCQHPRGRTAYFPAAMDAAYYDAGYPYQRILLANAVRWAAGKQLPVIVSAPKCVMAGFFTQPAKGGMRTVVHLLNGINTTTGHGSKNDKEFAFREEVVPIGPITVTFSGNKPDTVELMPGQVELPCRQTDRGWEVTVPQLGVHAVVCAQYQATK